MIALYCIGGIVALILVAIILGASYEIVASQRARAKFADASGELVTINNRKLHLNIMGERRAGQPVVILESSVGANSLDWQLVQPTIAEHAQVISYDRAGNGWSEQASSPRTPQAIVTDLHDALQSAGVEPPYLMVGHRYGGLYVRKYQEHFPDDVIGLVLVDSSHPDVFEDDSSSEINRLQMNVNVFQRVGIVRYVTRNNQRVTLLPDNRRAEYAAMMMHDNRNLLPEARHILENGIELPATIDIPLIVVSRAEEDDIARERRWAEYQRDFLALSSDSKHIHTETSKSWILFAEPQTISNAILDLLNDLTPSSEDTK